MFLIEKLSKLQETDKRANPSSLTPGRTDVKVRLGPPWDPCDPCLPPCEKDIREPESHWALHFLCLHISVFFIKKKTVLTHSTRLALL